jgi:hypothetical protein
MFLPYFRTPIKKGVWFNESILLNHQLFKKMNW